MSPTLDISQMFHFLVYLVPSLVVVAVVVLGTLARKGRL